MTKLFYSCYCLYKSVTNWYILKLIFDIRFNFLGPNDFMKTEQGWMSYAVISVPVTALFLLQ
jgi:hypothetical protein